MMKTNEVRAVELKRTCQEIVAREAEGLSNEERRRRILAWLNQSDHPLAVAWRRNAKVGS